MSTGVFTSYDGSITWYICSECCLRTEKAMLICGGCEMTRYCSLTCQKQHWKTHKELCNAVKGIKDEYVRKIVKDRSLENDVKKYTRNEYKSTVQGSLHTDGKIITSKKDIKLPDDEILHTMWDFVRMMNSEVSCCNCGNTLFNGNLYMIRFNLFCLDCKTVIVRSCVI
jgi:hypothetical protein